MQFMIMLLEKKVKTGDKIFYKTLLNVYIGV